MVMCLVAEEISKAEIALVIILTVNIMAFDVVLWSFRSGGAGG